QCLPPDLAQPWPRPLRQGSDLAWLQVCQVPDWRKSNELKDEVAKPKDGECDPNPLVAPKAVNTVTQSLTHRCEKHHQRVTTAKPQPTVRTWHRLPCRSKLRNGRNGVMDYRSNAT